SLTGRGAEYRENGLISICCSLVVFLLGSELYLNFFPLTIAYDEFVRLLLISNFAAYAYSFLMLAVPLRLHNRIWVFVTSRLRRNNAVTTSARSSVSNFPATSDPTYQVEDFKSFLFAFLAGLEVCSSFSSAQFSGPLLPSTHACLAPNRQIQGGPSVT